MSVEFVFTVGGDHNPAADVQLLAESFVGVPREFDRQSRLDVESLTRQCDWDGGRYGEPFYVRIPGELFQSAYLNGYDPQPISEVQSTSNQANRLRRLAAND